MIWTPIEKSSWGLCHLFWNYCTLSIRFFFLNTVDQNGFGDVCVWFWPGLFNFQWLRGDQTGPLPWSKTISKNVWSWWSYQNLSKPTVDLVKATIYKKSSGIEWGSRCAWNQRVLTFWGANIDLHAVNAPPWNRQFKGSWKTHPTKNAPAISMHKECPTSAGQGIPVHPCLQRKGSPGCAN